MAVQLQNLTHETSTNEELKNLLEENLKLTQETNKMVRSIKHHIVLEQVLNIIKILVIVIPIVLGIIYLPTILKPYLDQYNELMKGAGMQTMDLNSAINQLSPDTINNLMKMKK